jgi:hypothetical protein
MANKATRLRGTMVKQSLSLLRAHKSCGNYDNQKDIREMQLAKARIS